MSRTRPATTIHRIVQLISRDPHPVRLDFDQPIGADEAHDLDKGAGGPDGVEDLAMGAVDVPVNFSARVLIDDI